LLVFGSLRPMTQYCGSVISSKRMRCFALVAAIFVANVSPAAAEDPEPLPAPTLPAPDPAPPAPVPARPAPVKKPAARPAPAPAPARVAPAVSPAIETPAPQSQARPSTPVRAKRPSRTKPAATIPAEPIRRLPIRDASPPPLDETTLVLTAARIGEDDPGFGAIGLVAALWLGLAAALLVVAYVVRFAEVPQPFGMFLYERRSVLALIGVNMVAAAAICYLVVGMA
jgi:hypothetical protein